MKTTETHTSRFEATTVRNKLYEDLSPLDRKKCGAIWNNHFRVSPLALGISVSLSLCSDAQPSPTLCNPMGIAHRLLCLWNFPSKNTGVRFHGQVYSLPLAPPKKLWLFPPVKRKEATHSPSFQASFSLRLPDPCPPFHQFLQSPLPLWILCPCILHSEAYPQL